MIKHTVDDIAYSFSSQTHLEHALKSNSRLAFLQYADIAICFKTNSIVKLRYPLEYIMDKLIT